jgi:hypothetical protein
MRDLPTKWTTTLNLRPINERLREANAELEAGRLPDMAQLVQDVQDGVARAMSANVESCPAVEVLEELQERAAQLEEAQTPAESTPEKGRGRKPRKTTPAS